MVLQIHRYLICSLILLFLWIQLPAAFAQEAAPELNVPRGKAPMESIFHNVLWGSLAGGVVYSGLLLVDDSKTREERQKAANLTTQFVIGATVGGLIGLGAGVYFSLFGITFEEGIVSFVPPSESDYHGQQRRSYGNSPQTAYNQPVFSLQVQF
ncbi:MAG: hypothetical protein COB67_02985 [SAR324 cluster bacterium]|uniref:Uncharacterized protein n=1 Tax=SAR324 cluster bacterium TaxID=2024889 RepID=A0A2A4T8C3_9DELT|nr:MAG: hypothetical protein COB67_02985 [SAR324 cluster bacterium]